MDVLKSCLLATIALTLLAHSSLSVPTLTIDDIMEKLDMLTDDGTDTQEGLVLEDSSNWLHRLRRAMSQLHTGNDLYGTKFSTSQPPTRHFRQRPRQYISGGGRLAQS